MQITLQQIYAVTQSVEIFGLAQLIINAMVHEIFPQYLYLLYFMISLRSKLALRQLTSIPHYLFESSFLMSW